MRRAILVLAVLAGCYAPSPVGGAPCSSAGLCPSPLVCSASVCVAAGASGVDAPGGAADAPGATDAAGGDAASPRDAGPIVPAGAVLLLAMDDSPTDGALDSAHAHVVTCGTKCPQLITDGRIGSAYRFKNTNGSTAVSLSAAPPADFAPGAGFSLATWFRLGTTPAADTFYALVAKSIDGTDSTYGLLVDANLKGNYYTSNGTFSPGAATITLDVWHHLAMTWDGHHVIGYLDGAQDLVAPIQTLSVDATQPLTIGQVNGTGYLGDLDELVYYDRVLSPNEIGQLANP